MKTFRIKVVEMDGKECFDSHTYTVRAQDAEVAVRKSIKFYKRIVVGKGFIPFKVDVESLEQIDLDLIP